VKPDKYLISIKSRSGIEGARIYIAGDSIQINDRINRKLYYGTSIYLQKKFGFNQSFLPMIFGDLILDKSSSNSIEKCIDDKVDLNCQLKGILLNYKIDCKKCKLLSAKQIGSNNTEGLNLKFTNYISTGNILVPGKIECIDKMYDFTAKIKILKVQSPWSGDINFMRGKGYELIELR